MNHKRGLARAAGAETNWGGNDVGHRFGCAGAAGRVRGAAMTSEMVAAVAETPAEITGIPSVPAALVLNSGACDLVVDNGPDASLNPQSGCRLKAGELMTFPARDGRSLQLYAVAAGPGGQVTEVIFPDDGGVES